ncbi:MAG: cell division protein FtsX [Acidimicrobiales bacterium]
MAVSLDYVARETASNLWRNRLMTVAAVLTVAVSLFLVGSAFLMRQGVQHATTQWQRGVNVLVFLNPGTNMDQVHSVKHELVQLPYVQSCAYYSQQYDYTEAVRLLPADESQALTLDTTPSSLRCVLQNPNEAQAVVQQFRGNPVVASVNYPGQAIHSMEEWTRWLQIGFLVLAVILLLSASVLILNTIRLAIFARRREVSVMKLVGATNWFIRVPFMTEGLVQGAFGALVAVLLVSGLHWMLDSVVHSGILFQMRTTTGDLILTNVLVALVGVAVGTLGSAFAIRRFLDA